MVKYDLDIENNLEAKVTYQYKLGQIVKMLLLNAVGTKISDELSGSELPNLLYGNKNYIDNNRISTIIQTVEKQIKDEQEQIESNGETIDPKEKLSSLQIYNISQTATGIFIYVWVKTQKNQDDDIILNIIL